MNEWFYARGGQQNGPVTFEKLQELSLTGGLDGKDLVWTSTMKDWLPASQVDGLFRPLAAPAGASAADPSNPYAAPPTAWNEVAQATSGEALSEIVHGSEPVNVGACLKRAFALAQRHAVVIILVVLVYIGISFGLSIITQIITAAMSVMLTPAETTSSSTGGGVPILVTLVTLVLGLLNNVVSVFLSLGVTQITLNLVSGKEANVGLLFSGLPKLLRAIGASILYTLMVMVGLILLVVPGIFLAIRFAYFMHAIVDRDKGVIDSLSYSWSLTTNNWGNIFLLGLLSFGLAIAGLLALCVGVLVAIPIIMLMSSVAYRWMQYGHRAALDHNGTTVPMLAKI